jgi:hypothetical protein
VTNAELQAACLGAIRQGVGLALTVEGPAPRGERIRLVRGWNGGGCPLGDVLNHHDGRTLARFDPAAILRFLAANRVPGPADT